MNTHLPAKQYLLLFAIATILFLSSSAFGAVTITVKNNDGAGVGFNDNTPVSPVGGNNGTTLGQQRLIAVQHAADLWGAVLTSNSNAPIVIAASWPSNLACAADGATLASAGSSDLKKNFLGSVPFTWYAMALANAISGTDQNGANVEIIAVFNRRLGSSTCLPTRPWYNGLDNNHGSGVDLVTVALHEFGHGLGFSSFTDEETGIQPSGTPSIYDRFLLDITTGKLWSDMSNAERVTSAINFQNLVWIGSQVTASVPTVLTAGAVSNHPRLYTPSEVEVGSSVSHFDISLTRNQLMEPIIRSDLTHSVQPPEDLTLPLLRDIGWNGGPPPAPTPPPPPPPNDNFLSAQVISGCTGVVAGTNASATHEPGEQNHLSDGTGGTHSVWYQWQAPVSASVTIDTAGSNYDTALAIYTGTAVNNLAVIGKNDDVIPAVEQTSILTFNAVAGTIYKIAVDGFDGGDGGDFGPIKLNWNQSNCVGSVPGAAPQILLEESSPIPDQAAILDSVLRIRDPFLLVNPANFFNPVSDQNTRVAIFVANLPATPEVTISLIGGNNQMYEITPVAVNQFTEVPFHQVTFRLPDGLSPGTCRVRVFSRSLVSNTATFRML